MEERVERKESPGMFWKRNAPLQNPSHTEQTAAWVENAKNSRSRSAAQDVVMPMPRCWIIMMMDRHVQDYDILPCLGRRNCCKW